MREISQCVVCAATIDPARLRRRAITCSVSCYKRRAATLYHKDSWRSSVPTGTVGAVQELVVATALMKAGWDVFRALSPACPCDLMISRNGSESLRVEITTGQRKCTGQITFPRHKLRSHAAKCFDYLAVVDDSTIKWFPSEPKMALASNARIA